MAKIDREKVMKGLTCCTNGDVVVPLCEECPYTGPDGTCATLSVMHQDALELLKEQTPVEPVDLGVSADFIVWGCPVCDRRFDYDFKYCPYCGRAVKWDE